MFLGEHSYELVEIVYVLRRVVGVREVAGPDESVIAIALGEGWDSSLIGVATDPDLALEILAWLVLEGDPPADEGVVVHSVDAVEPVTDPTATGLQNQDFELGKQVEDAIIEQGGELVANAVRSGD